MPRRLPGMPVAPSDLQRQQSELPHERGVPQGVYLNWIHSQLKDEASCLELPLTLILLLSFSGLAILHLSQHRVLACELAVERDVLDNANFAFDYYFGHKGLMDVNSFADFWSFVRLGLVPLLVQPSWGYSEGFDSASEARWGNWSGSDNGPPGSWRFGANGPDAQALPVRGDYLHYSRIIGGLRFRQQVAEVSESLCRFPSTADTETWQKWYGKPCMPAWKELVFDPTSVQAEQFSDAQRVEWMLLQYDSFEQMLGMAVDMEDGCQQLEAKNRTKCLCQWCAEQSPPSPWLTEETQRIEIGFATFNAQYGLITYAGVNLFFNRGRFIAKRVEVMSSWIDPLASPLNELIPMLVCDVIWLSMLFYILGMEIKEVFVLTRESHEPWYRTLWYEYVGPWNLVDWVSVLVALLVVVLYASLFAESKTLHDAFRDIIDASEKDRSDITREQHLDTVQEFYQRLDTVCNMEKNFRLSLCIYPMMVMMRLFKSFSAQARLAVVTETLVVASNDMLHFGLVFLSVFACICLNSVMLFGQDLMDFATFPRALHTCFRMMFGDWDWKQMEHARRNQSMAWFCFFMVVVVIILLNMFLAIVMEAYSSASKDSQNAISLFTQMKLLVRRRREFNQRLRVRLNDIWDAFLRESHNEKEMIQSEELITAEILMQKVPGIPKSQAQRTLGNAWTEHLKKKKQPFELENTVAPLKRITQHARHVRDELFYSCNRVLFYDTMEQKGAADQPPDPEPSGTQSVTAPVAPATLSASVDELTSATATNAAGEITQDTLDFVSDEVTRLSAETASVLAQTMRRLDQRQVRLEQRQSDMAAAINQMIQTMQTLQSDASSLTTQLRYHTFGRAKSAARGASAWRKGISGTVVKGCFDCNPGDAEAHPLQMPQPAVCHLEKKSPEF